MSWKKKRLNNIRKIIFISLFIIVLLILLILHFIINNFKDYYQIDSRIDKVSQTKKNNKSEYQTIGWIKVQGTNIDYPIIRTNNDTNEYPVELESYGWTYNEDNKFHNVVNIYGHNIFNLGPEPKKSADNFKRFEELMSFIYYDFAKENKYIQLTIDDKDYVYKIYAVSFINLGDIVLFPKGEYSKNEKNKYLKLLQKNSIYDYNIDVNNKDKLISISTCTRFLGIENKKSILVSGRLVRSGEKLNNYLVEKNKNYKKIDEVLKGDDSNENVESA